MRTTLNIADDVLCAVKEKARRQGRSSGEILSELTRSALASPVIDSEIGEGESFYGFEPLPRRGSVVSNELIDRLLDQEPE